MSEFVAAMLDATLPEVEEFMKYLAQKQLTPETAKRLKKSEEAIKTLRRLIDGEKLEVGT